MECLVDKVGSFVLVTCDALGPSTFHTTLYCGDGCGSFDVVCESCTEEEAREVHGECVRTLAREVRVAP